MTEEHIVQGLEGLTQADMSDVEILNAEAALVIENPATIQVVPQENEPKECLKEQSETKTDEMLENVSAEQRKQLAKEKKIRKSVEKEKTAENDSDCFDSDSSICTPPAAPKKKRRLRHLHFRDDEVGEEFHIVAGENREDDPDFEDLDEVNSQTSMQSDGTEASTSHSSPKKNTSTRLRRWRNRCENNFLFYVIYCCRRCCVSIGSLIALNYLILVCTLCIMFVVFYVLMTKDD